jgi:predicted RNase H-like nuclease (RuvC/YqgF family)
MTRRKLHRGLQQLEAETTQRLLGTEAQRLKAIHSMQNREEAVRRLDGSLRRLRAELRESDAAVGQLTEELRRLQSALRLLPELQLNGSSLVTIAVSDTGS